MHRRGGRQGKLPWFALEPVKTYQAEAAPELVLSQAENTFLGMSGIRAPGCEEAWLKKYVNFFFFSLLIAIIRYSDIPIIIMLMCLFQKKIVIFTRLK
jgi:hypothetical protein